MRTPDKDRQAAYRARNAMRTLDLRRMHNTICAAAAAGNADAMRVAGGSIAETISKLADEVESQFNVSAAAN